MTDEPCESRRAERSRITRRTYSVFFESLIFVKNACASCDCLIVDIIFQALLPKFKEIGAVRSAWLDVRLTVTRETRVRSHVSPVVSVRRPSRGSRAASGF